MVCDTATKKYFFSHVLALKIGKQLKIYIYIYFYSDRVMNFKVGLRHKKKKDQNNPIKKEIFLLFFIYVLNTVICYLHFPIFGLCGNSIITRNWADLR